MLATIIIPTYNEASNIGDLIRRIRGIVPGARILIVDDNSPDGTHKIVREIALRDDRVELLLREKKSGLGAAYIAGFKQVLTENKIGVVNAEREVIVMMDADFSHNPKYLPELFHQAQNFDVVLGSRYVEGGKTVGWELWRRALSYFGNTYARIIAGLPVLDCTGGFNVISVTKLRKIDLDNMNASGYAFIMGLKFALVRVGATFKEVPILFKNRTGGESKLSKGAIARYFREGILAPWKMRLARKQ